MKKFYIFFYFFLTIIFLQNLSADAQTVSEKKDSAVLKISEKIYDFGTVKQGQATTHEFKVTNTGNKPLVISEVVRGCGCTTPKWTQDPIMPGQQGSIWATFKSDIGYGHIMKPLHIHSNATIPEMDIYIQGELLNEKMDGVKTDSTKKTSNPQ